jgi:hypothetical protein
MLKFSHFNYIINLPILVYHHIQTESPVSTRLAVSFRAFKQYMSGVN